MVLKSGCLGIIIIGLILVFQESSAAVTREQLKQSAKVMRDICMPKFKISSEIADKISGKDIPTDKVGKCYVNCVLEMMQSIKKGKILYESSKKQIDLLIPDDMKPAYKAGLEACKTSDNCEAGVEFLACLFANNPEFLFP